VNSEGNFEYKYGIVEVMDPLDVDKINIRGMVSLFKNLGYHDYKAMYWQNPEDMYLETGLMPLEKDSHINAMVECMMRSSPKNQLGDYQMHVFFEHPILDIEDTEFVTDPTSEEESVCNRGVFLNSQPPAPPESEPQFQAASESEPTPTEIPEPAPAEPASVPLECAEPAPAHADFVEAASVPVDFGEPAECPEGRIDAEQGSCSRNKGKATVGSRKKRKVACRSRNKKVKAPAAPAGSKSGKKKEEGGYGFKEKKGES